MEFRQMYETLKIGVPYTKPKKKVGSSGKIELLDPMQNSLTLSFYKPNSDPIIIIVIFSSNAPV